MKTRGDIEVLMGEIFKECQGLREAGQKEYAHLEENVFGNFERIAQDFAKSKTPFVITREQVLWIYLKKHLDGILSHINGHRSQREPVRGRIKDAIVYLILLQGMFEDNDSNLKLADPVEPRW